MATNEKAARWPVGPLTKTVLMGTADPESILSKLRGSSDVLELVLNAAMPTLADLLAAVEQGDLEAARRALDEGGVDVNVKSEAERKGCCWPLMVAVKSRNVAMVELLLEKNADVHLGGENSVLHWVEKENGGTYITVMELLRIRLDLRLC